jgi:predicted dinucleotide-binding enzyme
MPTKHQIAILGAGNVGGALGRVWAGQGHDVVFGVSDPKSPKVTAALSALQGKARAASNAEAAGPAGVVVLSVPWPAAQEALRAAGSLAGKILIDCTNPLAANLQGLSVGLTTSAAEQVAGWAPGAKVVKAFNTLGAVNFGNAQFGSQRADGYYCGDDAAAKAVVKELIEQVGLDPVDVGPLTSARLLEPLAMLWISLGLRAGYGP